MCRFVPPQSRRRIPHLFINFLGHLNKYDIIYISSRKKSAQLLSWLYNCSRNVVVSIQQPEKKNEKKVVYGWWAHCITCATRILDIFWLDIIIVRSSSSSGFVVGLSDLFYLFRCRYTITLWDMICRHNSVGSGMCVLLCVCVCVVLCDKEREKKSGEKIK